MDKSKVNRVCKSFGLSPNKRLGQSFLVNDDVTNKIICAISPGKDDEILEIGPGLGALTDVLIDKAASVTAVEIDNGISKYLEYEFNEKDNFKLIHGDFLKQEVNGGFNKVVSNLPYYCASEILFKIAENFNAGEVYVMLQRDMAERIISGPGSKSYGSLTVTLGFYYKPKILFHVSNEAFYPRPEIESSFMSLARRENLLLKNPEDLALFKRVVKSAFWGRRKIILNSLTESPHLDFNKMTTEKILKAAGIPNKERGENLSIDNFVNIVSIIRDID
ncbi:16S rRNA (adenine(1518)-N(6)/adenine(1519)-N(6))-dimethyltransferase RsmA [Spirochaetota bacterium]